MLFITLAQIDPSTTLQNANDVLQNNTIDKLLLGMVTVLIVSAAAIAITFLRRGNPGGDGSAPGTIVVELARVMTEQNEGLHDLADAIRAEIDERKEANKQFLETHKAIRTQVDTIENDVTALKLTVAGLETKVDELKNVISQPQSLLPEIQERLNGLTADIRLILDIIRRDTNEVRQVQP